MGKTTLMHMIELELMEDRSSAPALPTVWFNAWAHEKDEPVWVALALTILRLSQQKFNLRRRASLWRDLNVGDKGERMVRGLLKFLLRVVGLLLVALICVWVILRVADVQLTAEQAWRYIGLIGGLGVIATLYNTIGKDVYKRVTGPLFKRRVTRMSELNLAEISQTSNLQKQVGLYSEFEADFAKVTRAVTDNGSHPLVVFIDDFDRVAPSKTVELIKAIELYLYQANCVFIVGMDGQAAAKSIETAYKDLAADNADADTTDLTVGRHVLEKLVQLPIGIPKPDPQVFDTFVYKNLKAAVRERKEIIEAERLLDDFQRSGKSLDEAAKMVQEDDITLEEALEETTAQLAEAKAQLLAKSLGESDEVGEAIAYAVPFLEYNPRKAKRFINVFTFHVLLHNWNRLFANGTVPLIHFAKWLILMMSWPAITDRLMYEPDFLDRLLQAHNLQNAVHEASTHETEQGQVAQSELEALLADPLIRQLYRDTRLIELLQDLSSSEAEVLTYLSVALPTTWS